MVAPSKRRDGTRANRTPDVRIVDLDFGAPGV